VPAALATPVRVVWSRHQVSTDVCPKSLISGQSLAWMEEFFLWRKLGRAWPQDMDARKLEAFLILQQQMEAEALRARP